MIIIIRRCTSRPRAVLTHGQGPGLSGTPGGGGGGGGRIVNSVSAKTKI